MLTLLALAAMALPTILVVVLLMVAALAGRPAGTPAVIRWMIESIRGHPGTMHPAGTMGGAPGRSGGTDSVIDPLQHKWDVSIRMTAITDRLYGRLSQTNNELWTLARAEPRLT